MRNFRSAIAVFLALLVATTIAQARQFPGNDNDRPINTVESVRRAINDMISQFGDDYPNGELFLKELDELEKEADIISELKNLEITQITPLEAMNILFEYHNKVNE